MDPCVTEELLKRYIAYKAETNFVDVVPQAAGLQLTLICRLLIWMTREDWLQM